MIKVLVFDFDGVILESVAVKDQAIFDLFEEVTLEERKRVLEVHRQTPGINRRERMVLLLTRGLGRDSTPEEIERLLERFGDLVWDGLMTCPEVSGVRRFLEQIYTKIPCYVISAAPQDEIRSVAKARDFSRYFVELFGTPPAKKDRLKEIMTRENVFGRSMLFIGDKISDYTAAQNTGVNFVGKQSEKDKTNFLDEIVTINDFTTFIKIFSSFQSH